MLLLFRFLLLIFKSGLRSKIGPLEESVVRFTVLPNDCDLNFHLNGGRFLSFMDVARVELLGRTRLLRKVLRQGWRPVMAGCVIRFRRSILPFERFSIRTRLLAWDERWFYLEHLVERDGQLCAVAHVRLALRGKQGTVAPAEVLALLAPNLVSPELPPFVAQWRDAEDAR
jgi:acyl-CoA thioesterase FadM